MCHSSPAWSLRPPQVESQFDGPAPDVTAHNFTYDGKTVVALWFETDLAPFVVTNPKSRGGFPERVVPWRSATRLRAAHRQDLVRMLVPAARAPECEVLSGSFAYAPPAGANAYPVDVLGKWKLDVSVYVTPRARALWCPITGVKRT